jgi:cyclase
VIKKRITPILLFKNNNIYKGKNFKNDRLMGDIKSFVNIFNLREADEIIIINLESSYKNKILNFETLKEISKINNLPLTYGGGINSLKDIKNALKYGADKVVINTSSINRFDLIGEAIKLFGTQSISICLDYKYIVNEKKYKLLVKSGSQLSKIDVKQYIDRLKKIDLGEIIINNFDRDGTLEGLDFKFTKYIKDFSCPKMIIGGVKNLDDFYKAFKKYNYSAVGCSSLFLYTSETPLKIKNFLQRKKIDMRK